jgi:hypothetical protein
MRIVERTVRELRAIGGEEEEIGFGAP